DAAQGYNILWGIAPDKLYSSWMVYGHDELLLKSLNRDQTYYFAIEAFYDNGISSRSKIHNVEYYEYSNNWIYLLDDFCDLCKVNSTQMDTRQSFQYERIAKAIHYIVENYRFQPSLEEMASAAHLSPMHFQRLFTEWAGTSPK